VKFTPQKLAQVLKPHTVYVFSHSTTTTPTDSPQHQVGQLVSEADHAPEFNAKTLPAGSAPSANTFSPNPDANDAPVNTSGTSSAQDTITGATSADVHTGLGHPGQGQSSSELHDGSKKSGGLQGVGAGGAVSHQDVAAEKVEPEGVVPGASGKKTGGDLKPGVSQMSKDEKYTSQLEQGSAKEENVRGQ